MSPPSLLNYDQLCSTQASKGECVAGEGYHPAGVSSLCLVRPLPSGLLLWSSSISHRGSGRLEPRFFCCVVFLSASADTTLISATEQKYQLWPIGFEQSDLPCRHQYQQWLPKMIMRTDEDILKKLKLNTGYRPTTMASLFCAAQRREKGCLRVYTRSIKYVRSSHLTCFPTRHQPAPTRIGPLFLCR